ncbi:uncharacterized protein METZ01_LOCUS289637, partial [marine metagenome]
MPIYVILHPGHEPYLPYSLADFDRKLCLETQTKFREAQLN